MFRILKKPKTTLEQLNKLAPVFKKGGTVNAGNASGVCDGAASLIVASGEAVKVKGQNFKAVSEESKF